MARFEDPKNAEETVVKINRCTTVTKGGKSMSFSALVVVGDKKEMLELDLVRRGKSLTLLIKLLKKLKSKWLKYL